MERFVLRPAAASATASARPTTRTPACTSSRLQPRQRRWWKLKYTRQLPLGVIVASSCQLKFGMQNEEALAENRNSVWPLGYATTIPLVRSHPSVQASVCTAADTAACCAAAIEPRPGCTDRLSASAALRAAASPAIISRTTDWYKARSWRRAR